MGKLFKGCLIIAGAFFAIIVLTLIIHATCDFSPSPTATIIYSDPDPLALHGARLTLINTSDEPWESWTTTIKYDGKEYVHSGSRVGTPFGLFSPGDDMIYYDGYFKDKDGNFVDLRYANRVGATIGIKAKTTSNTRQETVILTIR